MTEMYFDLDFEASAKQETTLTVLGESGAAKSPDDTIEITVTAAQMASMLPISSGWAAPKDGKFVAGEQPYPTVQLKFGPVGTELGAADTALQTFDSAPGVLASDCAVPAAGSLGEVKTLQKYFLGKVFDYSASSNTELLSIPPEAIKLIEQSAATDVTPLTTVLDGGSSIGPDDAMAADADLPRKKAVRALLEQAVGADKWKYTTSTDGVANDGHWDFAVGDSMTFYVHYSLEKSRTYKPDADVLSVGGAQHLNIAGASFAMDEPKSVTGTAEALVAVKFIVGIPSVPVA